MKYKTYTTALTLMFGMAFAIQLPLVAENDTKGHKKCKSQKECRQTIKPVIIESGKVSPIDGTATAPFEETSADGVYWVLEELPNDAGFGLRVNAATPPPIDIFKSLFINQLFDSYKLDMRFTTPVDQSYYKLNIPEYGDTFYNAATDGTDSGGSRFAGRSTRDMRSGLSQFVGNSGVILLDLSQFRIGPELQIVDSYLFPSEVRGTQGAQYINYQPLVSANRPASLNLDKMNHFVQVYTGAKFNEDNSVKVPAKMSVFLNDICIQYKTLPLYGTGFRSWSPPYNASNFPGGPATLLLQMHDEGSPNVFGRLSIANIPNQTANGAKELTVRNQIYDNLFGELGPNNPPPDVSFFKNLDLEGNPFFTDNFFVQPPPQFSLDMKFRQTLNPNRVCFVDSKTGNADVLGDLPNDAFAIKKKSYKLYGSTQIYLKNRGSSNRIKFGKSFELNLSKYKKDDIINIIYLPKGVSAPGYTSSARNGAEITVLINGEVALLYHEIKTNDTSYEWTLSFDDDYGLSGWIRQIDNFQLDFVHDKSKVLEDSSSYYDYPGPCGFTLDYDAEGKGILCSAVEIKNDTAYVKMKNGRPFPKCSNLVYYITDSFATVSEILKYGTNFNEDIKTTANVTDLDLYKSPDWNPNNGLSGLGKMYRIYVMLVAKDRKKSLSRPIYKEIGNTLDNRILEYGQDMYIDKLSWPIYDKTKTGWNFIDPIEGIAADLPLTGPSPCGGLDNEEIASKDISQEGLEKNKSNFRFLNATSTQ